MWGGVKLNELRVDIEISDEFKQTKVFIQTNNSKFGNQLFEYVENFRTGGKRITIKQDDGYALLDTDRIIYCEVYQKKLTIYTDKEKLMIRKPLKEILESLTSKDFIQISKSAVVNIYKINRLEIAFSGNYYAFLTNGLKVTVSRRFVERLKERLGI